MTEKRSAEDAEREHRTVRERAHEANVHAHEIADAPATVHGHEMRRADVFKFAGLFVFIALMGLVVWLLWPYVGRVFEEGGTERLVADVRAAGPAGVFILLAFQFLQVVVAFIPGEVVQLVAGMLYGPWWGALIILAGCVVSSWFIYEVVHRLGQPFVEAMVPVKYLDKFRAFEDSGKLDGMVFLLFLIPGLPKDTFTYLVPLTDMPRNRYLVLSNVARIPGVVMSTYGAHGVAQGNYVQAAIVFVVVGGLAVAGFFFKDKLLSLGRRGSGDGGDEAGKGPGDE